MAKSTPPSAASTPGHTTSDTTSITTQTPDNVIGETLVVQGRVEFKNLLRIDGHFEGESVLQEDSVTCSFYPAANSTCRSGTARQLCGCGGISGNVEHLHACAILHLFSRNHGRAKGACCRCRHRMYCR